MQPMIDVDASSRRITARFSSNHATVGWQIFDPETGTFIQEGQWSRAGEDVRIDLPAERGRYHVYVSGIEQERGWAYQNGEPFLLIEASVERSCAVLDRSAFTTLRAMRRTARLALIRRLFSLPFTAIAVNKGLIQSMVRRDLLARYRGSFGGTFWTVLNPLLLMLTYFFVFGIVLQTRFGPDASRTGFTLYFLAGMLPWLAFSEAVGRSPIVIVEHRTFVKKLVFPLDILPINLTLGGLVTEIVALALFLLALLGLRGGIPATALALPLVLVPQLLFTLGLAWFFSALGVYVRDLAQVMGFLLTLLFFLTPICYPETQLPPAMAKLLSLSPLYALVRGYRALFLEGALPSIATLAALWIAGGVSFFAGYAWFYRLRRSFADVI